MHQKTLSPVQNQDRRRIHPLEPLNAEEIVQSVALLKTLKQFNPSTRVISIILEEPTKEQVFGRSPD